MPPQNSFMLGQNQKKQPTNFGGFFEAPPNFETWCFIEDRGMDKRLLSTCIEKGAKAYVSKPLRVGGSQIADCLGGGGKVFQVFLGWIFRRVGSRFPTSENEQLLPQKKWWEWIRRLKPM